MRGAVTGVAIVAMALGGAAHAASSSSEEAERRLDRAEAAARTPVTEPITVTGKVTGTDEDSVRVRTSAGRNLDLLLPPPQEEYRSGLTIGSPGELKAGDEVRATYRISKDGKTVVDTIEVTRPVGAKRR